MEAPTSSHVVIIYSLKYSFISSHSLFLSCNHNLPFLSPFSHYPTLSILPLQLWAMRVPLCRSWLQVWLSCRGSLTPWWSRHFLESFCKFLPCHVSSWLLSTSCSVWQKLSSPLRVRLTVRSPFGHIIQIYEMSMMWQQQERCSYSFCPLAGSLVSFQLTPSHIRGIALHFLTLSYGGGCFLGAFIIQLMYFLSGGKKQTNKQIQIQD